jgi:hypothetical protein
MSVRHERWENYSICVVFIVGSIILLYSPIISILFFIIGFITIGIIYYLRTPNREVSTEPSVSPPIQTNEEQDLKFSTKTAPELETEDTAEALQQRIAELEKRIQLLNEQLAMDPVSSTDGQMLISDDFENGKEVTSEELSEKAIQHLLETLDEKLAKGAISEQLYTRLRDKYIARMEKTKRRRKAFAKRGTQDSNSGDS